MKASGEHDLRLVAVHSVELDHYCRAQAQDDQTAAEKYPTGLDAPERNLLPLCLDSFIKVYLLYSIYLFATPNKHLSLPKRRPFETGFCVSSK